LIALDSEKQVTDIVMFYPGDSMLEQVTGWAESRPDCNFMVSFANSLQEIRETLGGAEIALLDATVDPSRTMKAFSEAVTRIGAYSVAVYTERMHQWLELAVRVRGALLLLGPLGKDEWEGFFQRMLPPGRQGPTPAERQVCRPARPEDIEPVEQPIRNQLSAGRRRPKTGVM
jgi:hypothetical protein